MDSVVSLHLHNNNNTHYKVRLNKNKKNKLTHNRVFFSKILIRKPISCCCLSSAPSLDYHSTKHTTLLVESYHEHQALNALIQRLNKKVSCPLQILQHDGDWTKDHFWAVIRFLKNSSRSRQIPQVFDMWKNIEKSRINEFNSQKIIGMLCEEGLMEEAVRAFQEMEGFALKPSLEIYNSIIHGYSKIGKFNEALLFLNEMKEMNLSPQSDTYDGLIQAYEFACAGLLKRMEGTYKSMLTKRMHLRSSTMVAILDAYMNFGMLDKMEKFYKRLLNSRTPLKEDLVRKLAEVYIKNYMFSRLDDLGDDLASRIGRTELVWCLRLLSHACLLSHRGIDSVVREMESAKVRWNVTTANIILLAYLKMKDFKHLRVLLSELPTRHVKPDIVTIGILYDARRIGFDGTGALEMWKRIGFLFKTVEINTDPLVLAVYGKGHFLRYCEEVYSSLEPYSREKKRWTYQNLIDLVIKHNGKNLDGTF
ncbi:pentatricopeptide repeat-containing protein [Citrus sinensis]|uniref:pentatricopeptide repeat-containing protein At4g14190, chloroplastic n=1 Tax=Citrus sinensis TaxID=2711 RepID=UPI0021965328|nr:pentatricopeptide repeat-containing protein At4g14190, chloroplastic [Citrus sinensis]KAH9649522.1 pentatricopeptide repeat-containing protein [Citrus sinensis]